MIRTPQLRSTWARAVVPVVAGIGFFGLLGLALWGVAALTSRHPNEASDLLANRTFRRAHVSTYSKLIAADGPVLFPDLIGTDGDLSVVLDHTGADEMTGWRLYMAYPADRPIGCKVTQVPRTRTFRDCGGRTIPVEQLHLPPAGIRPTVFQDGMIELDLVPDRTRTGIPGTSPGTSPGTGAAAATSNGS